MTRWLRAPVAAALLAAVQVTAVAGQVGPLTGYSLTLMTASESSFFGDASASLFQRLRVMVRPSAGPLDFDVAYEHGALLQSEQVGIGLGLGAPVATTWLELQWTIEDDDHLTWTHRFDRLSGSVSGSAWEVTAGRQAISWATTLFLTPADPFAPFDPSDPFREYRAGVDAARLEWFPSSLSEIEVVVRPADTRDGTTMTALARAHLARGRSDVAAWAGVVHDDFGAAIGGSTSVGAFEVRGEASIREKPGEGESGLVLRFAVGADRRFTVGGRDLYVVAEYQHDDFGASGATDLIETVGSTPFSRGELQVLGRDEAAVSGAYQVHPLWGIELLSLVNLRDGSALIVPAGSYSAGANASVRGGLFLPWGDGTEDPGDGLGSEYGAVPLSGYVSLSLFF